MKKAPKTSQLIEDIFAQFSEDGSLTVAEFLETMGHRAQALAILIFSLAALVAGVVPGFSTLTGVPIMFIALQIALGMNSVWLPKKLREKEISPRILRGALARTIPTMRTVEKFLKPRLIILTHPYAERVVALIIVVLAAILSLPIPGGNFLPSIGISILALSMLERDGLFLLLAIGLVMLTGGVMIDLIMQAVHYSQLAINSIF